MAGNNGIQVPINVEDKTILRRFLNDLVQGITSNPYYTGNVAKKGLDILDALNASGIDNFKDKINNLDKLRNEIIEYVQGDLETSILANKDDLALIIEQFGAFHDEILAASWYGLSVKAGGAVAGLEIGSLDPNIVTPGDESSYFKVIADNFIVGKAYEDLTQEEKDYLAANNLPNFGTVYNADKTPLPALSISWDSANGKYDIYFNGIVNFSNIANTGHLLTNLYDAAAAINMGTTTINGGLVSTYGLVAETILGDSIISNDIIGSKITGAVIEGAVIKASYLDLDGELQVLTNYHLCLTQAQLNDVITAGGTGTLYTNSTLMPDAIPIKLIDQQTGVEYIYEYRIPSISQVREITVTGSGTIAGKIYSYDTTNANTNYKAVRLRPYIKVDNAFTLISISQGNINALHYKRNYRSFIFNIKFGSMTVCRVICAVYGSNGAQTNTVNFNIVREGYGTINTQGGSYVVNLGICNVTLNCSSYTYPNTSGGSLECSISVPATSDFNPTLLDLIGGKLLSITLEEASGWQYDAGVSYWDIPYPSIFTRIDSGISINNML